jgi:integrase
MVRNALWPEIEGVDWTEPDRPSPEALWRIPASKMKQELALREDEAFEHLVPLSAESVEVLRAVRPFSSSRGPIFPGGRDMFTPLSENAVGYLYNREGWKGRHVPHGWRSSFSTVMNSRIERRYPGAERLLVDRLVIDLMLAHTPSGMSATELIYNRQPTSSGDGSWRRIGQPDPRGRGSGDLSGRRSP